MMKPLESNRKLCLQQQTELRQILLDAQQHEKAIQLFLRQHAMLHSARVTQPGIWSFEDAVLDDMTEEGVRNIPPKCEHSIAWLIWHMARCEDITMNLLVAGQPQVISQDDWLQRMKSTICDTGNAMDADAMQSFSQAVDIPALRAYRLAVGRRTQEIARKLQPEELKQRVDPARLQTVWAEGAVVEAAGGIVDYWGKRTFAGLLLMPATRHNLIHLNEALLIKHMLDRPV